MRLLRSLATLAALIVAVLLWAEEAEARLEQRFGFNVGAAPVAAPTLLAETAPSLRTTLDHPTIVQSHPTAGTLGGLFNRGGLVAGFAAGFLGAGLLGAVFGQGLANGLVGAPSYFGLMFQCALLVMLVRVIWTWWNGRNAPGFTGLSPRQQAEAYLRSRNELLPGSYPLPGIDDAASESDEAESDTGATTAWSNNSQR